MTNRQQFLRSFIVFAEQKKYALLKMIYDTLEELPVSSDIDVLIEKEDLTAYEHFCLDHPLVEKFHIHHKSFISFVTLLFKDGSYLEIDLLFRFDRKGITYLDAAELLQHGIYTHNNLKVLQPARSFEYIFLFYMMNGAEVPAKYQTWFSSLTFEQRSEIFGYICHKYKVNLNTLDELYKPASRFRKKINGFISALPYNHGAPRFVHNIRYLIDTGRDMMNNKGAIITFSGVDGAGKSTVLNHMRAVLEEKYRKKVVVLRHRPGLLPILSSFRHGKKKAESLAASTLPRQGKNDSTTGSFFRFCYYYTDYLIGQFYVNMRYVRRGYTVLYDRYYFDFIVDARRSNIQLPKSIMKLGYHFVVKPSMNVFLYAPADVILKRKQEMQSGEIETLTNEYKELFDAYNKNSGANKYVSLNNIDLHSTLTTVEKHCIEATF